MVGVWNEVLEATHVAKQRVEFENVEMWKLREKMGDCWTRRQVQQSWGLKTKLWWVCKNLIEVEKVDGAA